MKISALFILLAALGTKAQATEASVLSNCYADPRVQFFESALEEDNSEGHKSVLLFNEKNEIVGRIAIEPKREKNKVHYARVVQMSLCSSLETDSFYYADRFAENIVAWAPRGTIEITQDEGMIEMSSITVEKLAYATKYKVEFKAYDVFTDEEDIEKQKDQPDFVEDWGIPKGKGTFYFFLPKNYFVPIAD